MNVKANMLIKDIEGLDDLFVAPSGGDESLAIGACYAYLDQIEKKTDLLPLENAYLGPDPDKEDISIVLHEAKAIADTYMHTSLHTAQAATQVAHRGGKPTRTSQVSFFCLAA